MNRVVANLPQGIVAASGTSSVSLIRRKEKFLVSLFVLIGLVLRLLIAFEERSMPQKDALEYDQLAMRLVQGRGYRDESGDLTAYRPPMYPLFLACVYKIAGHDVQAVRYAQAFLSAATVLLVTVLAFWVAGGKAACWAALIGALYPPFFIFDFGCSALISETLYAFFLTAAVVLLFRFLTDSSRSSAIVSGVAWGLAILTKGVPLPLVLLLPPLLLLLGFSWRDTVRYGFLAILAAGLVLAPWGFRNYRVFGAVVPVSTNGGASFYASNHAGSDGLGTGYYRNSIMLQDTRLRAQGWTELQRSDYFFRQGMAFVKNEPASALRLFAKKIYLYMDPMHAEQAENGTTRRQVNWAYVGILVLAVLGIFWGRKDKVLRRQFFLLASLFIYFVMFHAFFHSAHRYRLPTEPLLIALAAVALVLWPKTWSRQADTEERSV